LIKIISTLDTDFGKTFHYIILNVTYIRGIMKLTVKQLKQLIREQVEEMAVHSDMSEADRRPKQTAAEAAATKVLENSGFSGEVTKDGEITIFINYALFEENGYTLTEKGTRPELPELYLTFSPKE
jgi:hypothetical protein